MHKFFILPSLVLLIGFATHSQTLNQPTKLYGSVFDETGKVLVHAHIVNLTSQIGTLTNRDGQFVIHVTSEDTLKISSLGFKPSLLLIPDVNKSDIYKTIILSMDTIALSETIIYPYPATLEALKMEFLTLELEEDTPEFDLHLEKAGITPAPQTGMVISGPISAIYNKLSRHAKIQQKYEGLVYQEQLRIKSTAIYNSALVSKITGLKSEEDLKKFMEFCELEPLFILNSNEYDLFCAISNCYSEYLTINK
jgi:hypothetical protein